MSEREDLFQAVHDDPDNDAVRLVFADCSGWGRST
jgi:uncharacterized protein (TIGR02996 family)